MKTKLLTICLFLFTSQVFAHDNSSGFYSNNPNETPWAIAEEEGTGSMHEHLKDLKTFNFKCKEDAVIGFRWENRKYKNTNFIPEKFEFWNYHVMDVIRYKERTYTNCSDLKNPGSDCRYIEKYWRASMKKESFFDSFSCVYISTKKIFDCYNYTGFHPDGRSGHKKFRININTGEFMYSQMNFQDHESRDKRDDAYISTGFCYEKNN